MSAQMDQVAAEAFGTGGVGVVQSTLSDCMIKADAAAAALFV